MALRAASGRDVDQLVAHHDLGARASQAGGDVRVHEDVDRGRIVGRGADDGGHRGDAGVRPGRDAERLVEVGGARRDLHDHRTGSAPAAPAARRRSRGVTRCSTASASAGPPSTMTSTPRLRVTASSPRSHSGVRREPLVGSVPNPAMPRPSPSGANVTTTSARDGLGVEVATCQSSSTIPDQLPSLATVPTWST